MKKITIILIAILLVILVIALINNISISSKSGLETKESSAGSVSVAVMPRSLEESSATLDFERSSVKIWLLYLNWSMIREGCISQYLGKVILPAAIIAKAF